MFLVHIFPSEQILHSLGNFGIVLSKFYFIFKSKIQQK
jgi:hypothetical protein